MSPARWTPFQYQPMHVRPVWCSPACVWSVYGHFVAVAVVLLVRDRVSRLLVSLFGVGSLALQLAFAQLDLVRVGLLLVSVLVGASWLRPAWYVFTVRHTPTVGERSNDKWFDRCKNFTNLSPLSLSRPGSITCTTHHPVFCGALWPSFQLRPCYSYVHPRRWQGSVGPPWCVPAVPMGGTRCCSESVVRCSCSCLPACRAPYRAVFRGLCGWCVSVAVLSLAVRMARAARLVPWCRDFLSGVAGWARRNTSVPAGRGRRGPVWRARGPLRAPGRVSGDRNTGQCCSPPLAP